MFQPVTVGPNLAVGPQPGPEGIRTLAEGGFRTVLNLCAGEETDLVLSPKEEKRLVEQHGIAYHHLPIPSGEYTSENANRFRRDLGQCATPVYVHSRTAGRANALVLMDLALHQGLSGEQVLAEAERWDLRCKDAKLREWVIRYVDQHRL